MPIGPDQLCCNNFRINLADHDQVGGIGGGEQVAPEPLEDLLHHRPDPRRLPGADLLADAVQAGLGDPLRQAVRDDFGKPSVDRPTV